MDFIIDKQSLDELNLTGKFRQGSVYQLFNRVRTRGGEQLLDALFKKPLTEANRINERTAIFRFFQEARLDFPFDTQQVSIMREYIDAGSEQGLLGTLGTVLTRKLLSVLTHDDRFKLLIQGLQATIMTMKRCYAFAETLSLYAGPFHSRALEIKKILSHPQLKELLEVDIYHAITIRETARYDHLVRNRLNPELRELLHFISECDVNMAVAEVANLRGFTFARAQPAAANMLHAKDLRHPCLEDAVGNDLRLEAASNVVFLTGANMAGKSTWMKSIGIGMYLAHIGFPVAAAEMTFSVREGIFSSINVADNISLGYSHFYAEVVRVKHAADATATGKHLLLMFDELFKGTNVKDAYDGTLAVTEAFAGYRNCLFIVSTHIIEVGEALKQYDNIQFSYMPTVMAGMMPEYTYKLEKGITEDRQGMMIIRNEGILELIRSRRQ
ncbi:DNA mismatch repair protein [Chitinophaga sp. YIM B06452]|uniref:MutS-related protein n=1 Tax=Chitinophaga sp. YIM B06452 TaxID=3082158 RepID=UPI0031FF2688